jgi:hypothetical protein
MSSFGAVHQATISGVLARLRRIEDGTYRRDFRESARQAREVIEKLARVGTPKRQREALAQHISERANEGAVLVYRTKRNAEIRVLSVATQAAFKVPAEQVIGTYDHGADWRRIAEDLAA